MKEDANKYYQLEKELRPYLKTMGKAADAVLDQDVSSYPIFIVQQLEIELGIPLLARSEAEDLRWSVNVSSLEELASKSVVKMDKVDEFRSVYKDPRDFLCLFVLSDLGAKFIFLPRED